MKKIIAAILVTTLFAAGGAVALAETSGLGVVTSIASSLHASADAAGVAQVDTTICSLVLDEAGIITAIHFDVAQTKVSFDNAGQLLSDPAEELKTKKELGEAYGMRGASAIGKEVDEQMAFLEAWCIGKTVDEAITKANAGDDADLLAGCTIHVDAFTASLAKAAANAK